MILLTNTPYRMPVGPVLSQADAKTPLTAITVTQYSVQLYQMKHDGTAVVRTQFAPTASAGNNDMILVPSSTDGMYDLELTAAQLNWVGNGRITLLNAADAIIWFQDFELVSAQYFNFRYGTTAPSTVLTTAGNEAVADALLLRNHEGGNNSGRPVRQCLQYLRNRHELVGSTLTVYDSAGVASWTASVATDAGAVPITGITPA